jgi:hypothetical protein
MQSLNYPVNSLHSNHLAQTTKSRFGSLHPLGVNQALF